MKTSIAFASLVLGLAWSTLFPSLPGAGRALAGEARLGEPGQVVLSGDLTGGVHRVEVDGQSQTAVGVAAGIDWFALGPLSVGVRLDVGHGWLSAGDRPLDVGSASGSWTWARLGPRVGVGLPLAGRLSLWPRLEGDYSALWSAGGEAFSDWTVSVDGYAPLVAQVAPHLFVGLGPFYSRVLGGGSGSYQQADMGLRATLGGWL